MNPACDLSWLMKWEFQPPEGPEHLRQGFELLGRSVHYLIDSVPSDLLAKETSLGLSPAWVLGHFVLLLKNVLESFGGSARKSLSTDFATTYRAGGDGSAVAESPESLIRLFDIYMGDVYLSLRGVSRSRLSMAVHRDDFGLETLMPYESLGGYGAASIRYAGMYAIELAMLCEELS